MMNALPDGLVKWHRFVSEQDMQALAAALADDVVFRSPVLIRCGGIYIVAKMSVKCTGSTHQGTTLFCCNA
jgi:ketosteroid isomerase-like protein